MLIAICTLAVLIAILAVAWYFAGRLDLTDSRSGAIAQRHLDLLVSIDSRVAYLEDIEKKRMEVVGDTERAAESLEAEVAETLATANEHLAFRVRAYEERKAKFEQSFLVKPVDDEDAKGAEVA